MTNYLLAGGGTAGHVNPLLALAQEIKADSAENRIFALGTKEGLEVKLIPAAGLELLIIDRLPFPRKLSVDAVRFPFKFWRAVKTCQQYIREHHIEVVVGFGGYASAPAYLAARRESVPVVVHEANALPGWANKLGSRFAKVSAVAFHNTALKNAIFTGMPLRRELFSKSAFDSGTQSGIDIGSSSKITASRKKAREKFGLDPDTVTLLVVGGSLGAKKINDTIVDSRNVLQAAGVQVLHICGAKSELVDFSEKGYVRLSYCDDMRLAIQASDLAISRAGASTVSEFSALGLPAVFVPYPVGNGEQQKNTLDLLAVGGAQVVLDKDFNKDYVSETLIPLISNSKKLIQMSNAAKSIGVTDAAKRLLTLIKGVL